MSATERNALLEGLVLHDELQATVDERTLEILERRRRTAIVHRRGWLVRRLLLAADLVGLVAALAVAEWLVNRHDSLGVLGARNEVIAFVVSLPAWVLVAKVYGLYERDEERTDHSTVDEFSGVFHLVTVCTFLFWAFAYVTKVAHPTPPKLLIFWAAAVAFVAVGRATARTLARRNVAYLQNTIVVGAGDVGQLVALKVLQHPEYGLNVVGFVDSEPRERREDLGHLALLGGPDRLAAIVRMFDVERAIVAFSNASHEDTLDLIRHLKELEVQVDVVPRLFEMFAPNVGLHMLEGLPLVAMPPARLSWSSTFLKRALDIVVSLVTLAAALPLLLVIAVAVKLDSRGPLFYRHRRVGREGRDIDVLKFRTMRLEACRGRRYGGEGAEREFARLLSDPANAAAFDVLYKLADDPRVTRVGGLLRRLSLDELPQLANVIAGALSLVGPRPITREELERYGDDVGLLLSVRPGLTGFWQINGRSRLAYEDRVRLDLSYIRGWSFSLDLRILANTLRALATRTGAA